MNHRIAQGILYVLLFLSFALMSRGLQITHWIRDDFGVAALFAFMAAYTVLIAGLFWAIRRIDAAFPPLRLPPGDPHASSSFVEETFVQDETDGKAAENQPLGRGSDKSLSA